jgi:predicted house-cleaning noncanonical NTP pyrophosphatase (MazG superfamily)
MKRYQFDKLIRSKLPARMKNEGVSVNSESLSADKYIIQLKKKIIEEALEVQEASSKEELTTELADVMEVIHAIAVASNISLDEIESAKSEKLEVNGDFQPENYINYIEVAEDNRKVIEYLENKNRPYKLQN